MRKKVGDERKREGKKQKKRMLKTHATPFFSFPIIHTLSLSLFNVIISTAALRTMGLVDLETCGLGRGLVLPLVLFGRVPEDSIVRGRDAQVLSDTLNPGWEAIDTGAVRLDHRDLHSCTLCAKEQDERLLTIRRESRQNTLASHSFNQAGRRSSSDASPSSLYPSTSEHFNSYLDFRVVFNGRCSVSLVGQKDLVHTIVVPCHRMARVVPPVYLTKKRHNHSGKKKAGEQRHNEENGGRGEAVSVRFI